MVENYSAMRFLVVDDELHIRKIIKAVCSAMGVGEVLEAVDGRSALEVLRTGALIRNSSLRDKKRFDLIISDWMMPELTGIEFLRAVRTDRKLQAIPFLMLTAENERDMVARAIEEGVSDYIIKPFTADVLETKIKACLKKRRRA